MTVPRKTETDCNQYTERKGFCEDLDEGKYSLPLIWTVHHASHSQEVRDILQARQEQSKCTLEQKEQILAHMQKSGALAKTLQVLGFLHAELETEVGRLESRFGRENHELRLVIALLKV